MANHFKDKIVLITGGCGSIGSEIIKQVLLRNPGAIRVFDNRETAMFHLENIFSNEKRIRFLLGDIRDKERLMNAVKDVDIIFHAAALKHVPLCEYNPFEAVKTNVYGTNNLIEAALAQNVDKVINISTDKVTNTINTMGSSKLLSERLISSAHFWKGNKKTKFTSVRFGNIVGSRGSVVDLFKEQIKQRKPVTITDGEMTRFIMSIRQAVKLVLETVEEMEGGEVFILKMPVFKLKDMVDIIIDYVAPKNGLLPMEVERKIIGLRPGERMYEDLMTEKEAINAFETRNKLIILPQIDVSCWEKIKRKYSHPPQTIRKRYSSRDIPPLSKEKLRELIFNENII